jgi:hypothetical protein
MGRLIDCNDVYNAIQITTDNFGVAKKVVEDNMLTMLSKIETAEAISKADYENRLKADMVAMLTDIQLEIREYHEIGCDENCNNCRMVGCVEPVNVIKDLDIIQQKIDDLEIN